MIRLGTDGIHGCSDRGCASIHLDQKSNIHIPLCCRDVISSKNVKQRIFVVQLELKFLSRPVLLLPQEKAQQRLTLQSCNILKGRNGNSAQTPASCTANPPPESEYLAGSIRVEHLILDDKPKPLPVLLVALWPLQVAAHGGILRVGRNLNKSSGRWIETTGWKQTPRTQTGLVLASFRAAGIFFCFLVKEKAPDLMGETDVEAQRLPTTEELEEWVNTFVLHFSHELNVANQINQNSTIVFIYCSPAAWQSSDHTHAPAGSSSTPGSTCWQSKPGTPPVNDTGRWGGESGSPRWDVWADGAREAETLPQARQWCLLQVMVNSQVQIMHMVALRSGIQMGAFEPKGALSSTTASACVHRVKVHKDAFRGASTALVFSVLPPPDFCWRWRWSFSSCSRRWPWRWPPATRPALWLRCEWQKLNH